MDALVRIWKRVGDLLVGLGELFPDSASRMSFLMTFKWEKNSSSCRPNSTNGGFPKQQRTEVSRTDYQQLLMQKHGASEPEKLSRKFVSVKCGKCNNRGHNSRTCKGERGNARINQGGNEGSSQGGNA
uniref:CCHC-type domain-containing protein n=1 Tax=Lactuca sativa TaxID=4236 RepID=A0A9R1WG80_LACSA|nr:hypothetical protein LSAT_V11C200089710 [Lactuca sativa]